MRKLLLIVALIASSPLLAQSRVTVTGHAQDGSGSAVTSNSFVRFRLDNYGANVPRVLGTGIIVAPQPPDVSPNGSGQFTTTLWGNDNISPAGTQWIAEYWYNGQMTSSAPYSITGTGTFNLDNATANTSSPVIPSPTGDSTYLRLDGGNSNLLNSGFWASPSAAIGSTTPVAGTFTTLGVTTLNAKTVNGIGVAAQYGLTDSGIASAIAATPDGGDVYIPQGTYAGCLNLPIPITKRITVRGAGFGANIQVCSGASSSTDVFQIKPPSSAGIQGVTISNISITPASGTPAHCGIGIDGTNGAVGYLDLDHVQIGQLGYRGVCVENASGLVTGTPFTTTIRGASQITGGADFTNAGDSIHIGDSSQMGGVGNLLIDLIGAASSDQGAHGFVIDGGANITLNGGIVVQNATEGVIRDADIEQVATSTEANNCLIDIQGNASANIQDFGIVHSYLGANASYVGCAVRVDRATNALLEDNYLVQGSVRAVTVTANAVRTTFLWNRHAPDNPLSSWLSDSGTATFGIEHNQATGTPSVFGTGLGFSTPGGTLGTLVSPTQFKINPTNGSFCASFGDPSATACDTFLWRAGPNSWEIGNSFGDGSGQFIAAAFSLSTTNRANSGAFRLAKTDTINWRNNANTADVGWGIDASDRPTFNSLIVPTQSNQSANHGVCWKASGSLGYCSTVLASDGSCTCN